jgi:hypothetical protein
MANSNFREESVFFVCGTMSHARFARLITHLVTTVFRLASRGGRRAVVAESVLAKPLLILC